MAYTAPYVEIFQDEVNLLTSLSAVSAMGNSPMQKITEVGLLCKLLSDQNMFNVKGEPAIPYDDGMGNFRTVQIGVKARRSPAQFVTAPSCTPGTANPVTAVTATANLYTQDSVQIDRQTLRSKEKQATEFTKVYNALINQSGVAANSLNMNNTQTVILQYALANALLEAMNGMRVKVNQLLWTQIIAKLGAHITTGTTATVAYNMVQAAVLAQRAGELRLDGFEDLMLELGRMEVPGREFSFIGYGNLDRAMTALEISQGGINSSGVNMSSMYKNITYFPDVEAENTLGANQFLITEPGALELITFNENKGSYGSIGTTFMGTIKDYAFAGMEGGATAKPLEYDFSIQELDCAQGFKKGGYNVELSLRFGLFGRPVTNVYVAGDPLFGTNGNLRATAVIA